MSELKNDLERLRIDRATRRHSPWRWPLLLLLPALVSIVALWGLRMRQAWGALDVQTARVTLSDAGGATRPASAEVLTASGYVVARRRAVVSAKIQGRLAELRVEEGSRVRRDDVIARLESDDFAAQVERAEAQVLRAEADLAERLRLLGMAERLHHEGVVSSDDREAAESRVRIAEASVAQAQAEKTLSEAQFGDTLIRAPFTGTVVRKMAEVGESVAPIPPGVNISTASGAIVALADLDTLEVEADVSESNVARLTDGQPAEVVVEAFPERRYPAVLRQVIPTADRTRATVMVKVTIVEKDRDLKPEMSARVTFLADGVEPIPVEPGDSEPVLLVPTAALVSRDGRLVAFVIEGDRARERSVSTDGERDGATVVASGLTSGDVVVVAPPDTLSDGARVRTSEGDR